MYKKSILTATLFVKRTTKDCIKKLKVVGVIVNYSKPGGGIKYGNTNLGKLGMSSNPTTTIWKDYWQIPQSFSVSDLVDTLLHEGYHAGTGWHSSNEGYQPDPNNIYNKAQNWAEKMRRLMQIQARQDWTNIVAYVNAQKSALAKEQAKIAARMKGGDQPMSQVP